MIYNVLLAHNCIHLNGLFAVKAPASEYISVSCHILRNIDCALIACIGCHSLIVISIIKCVRISFASVIDLDYHFSVRCHTGCITFLTKHSHIAEYDSTIYREKLIGCGFSFKRSLS